MDLFRSSSKRLSAGRAPRIPPKSPRRMPVPITAQDRLSVVMEDPGVAPPPKVNASPLGRLSGGSWAGRSRTHTLPRASAETMPPPYAQFATSPTLGRRTGEKSGIKESKQTRKRGGWGKLLVAVLVLFLVIVALAVGLGVGLTRNKENKSATGSTAPAASFTPTPVFPMGEYSMITALNNVTTNCVSNPSTWRCYPYSTYDSNPSNSQAIFNWILSNTSSIFPGNGSSLSTSSNGVPANITISSSNNPFGVSFTNESVTYINNATNPRYTFSFTQTKNTLPSNALTTNNQASTCFFNQTQFVATMYLSNATASPIQSYPDASMLGVGGYQAWPYAVEVQQISGGGTDVPACYSTVNGVVGQRITGAFTAQPASSECVCDYRNFEL